MKTHKHLKRLERIWIENPIWFVTTCTRKRQKVLNQKEVADVLIAEWIKAKERHRWIIGNYVIMPDHVHFFCAPLNEAVDLAKFVGSWKEWTSKAITRQLGLEAPIWQSQFFDHLLRSEESYAEKWDYVQQNPVRAGLAKAPEDWPFLGEIEAL
jgi:putative transposase